MTPPFIRAAMLALSLGAAGAATAGDCYNDDVPQGNDLEPPPPGSPADLLRLSDEDVKQVLEKLRAYEERWYQEHPALDPGRQARATR